MMIVFCCVLPSSNKAHDDDDDLNLNHKLAYMTASTLVITRMSVDREW